MAHNLGNPEPQTRQPGYRWLRLALLLVLLAGCVRRTPGGQAPGGPQPSPPTTAASTLTLPAPSASPASTRTPAPSPTEPTPTEPGPTSTADLAPYNRQAWVESSPYGPWQAIFMTAYPEAADGSLLGEHYHVRVSLTNLESGASSLLVDEWRPYGLGFTVPQVLRWSSDSQYLFLAETGNADGSGAQFFQQLQRLDLQTGALAPLELPQADAWAISIDGGRLAYIAEQRLVVAAIENGERQELLFDLPRVEWRADQIVWSPEGQRILFSLRLNPFNPVDEMSGSLYLADLQAGTVRTLVDADRRRFSIRSFPSEGAAALADLEARELWLALPGAAISAEPPQDIRQAIQTLQSYFGALQAGRYAEAARWYGGSYAALEAANPDLPAGEPAEYLARACNQNGYQCLALDSLLLEQASDAGRYHFQVSFIDPQGGLFVLNPCCGADLETQPPVWLFHYVVQRDDNGRYKVMDLPVYVP